MTPVTFPELLIVAEVGALLAFGFFRALAYVRGMRYAWWVVLVQCLGLGLVAALLIWWMA